MKSFFRENKHYLLALLFFVSLFVLFFMIARDGTRNFNIIGDEATLETRVVNAARNIQYLGPYSRFGWNHPGPIFFYMLLPFYALYSMGTQSLYVGAAFLNLLTLFTILYYLYKSNDNYFFYFMAFFLSLYIAYFLKFNTFIAIWNPYVTILPLGALIFMSAYLSLGNLKVLPWQALFATFIVQTHVAYVPVVFVIIAVSLILYGRTQWRTLKEGINKPGPGQLFFNKKTLNIAAVTTGVLAVTWLLPLVEMIKNPPGNLLKLVYYFMSTPVRHGLTESLTAVSSITAAPLIEFLGLFYSGIAVTGTAALVILFFIQLALIAAAGIINHRHGKKYPLHLLVFGIIGLLVSIYSVTKITGEIYPYLTRWMSIIGFMNWAVIGFTFLGAIGRLLKSLEITAKMMARCEAMWAKIPIRFKKLRVVIPVLLISLGLLLHQWEAVQKSSSIKPNEAKHEYIGEISAAIENYVEKENISSFLMKPLDSLWPIEAGVVDRLYKSGSVSFSLEDNWLFWFGSQFKQRKAEKDIIYFKKETEPPGETPGRYLIYHTGECSVYYMHRQ